MSYWLALAVLLIAPEALPESGNGVSQTSTYKTFSISSELVPSPVDVGVLLPSNYSNSGDKFPVLLILHGGNQDNNLLKELKPAIDKAWEAGKLPPMIVATPSTGRTMYLDYRDGSQKWESFLRQDLMEGIQEKFRVNRDAKPSVAGLSMGGLGALRLTCKTPDKFEAVAAIMPAMPSAFLFDEIEDDQRRPDEFYWTLYGKPIDKNYWKSNHPLFVARENLAVIKSSGLAIYLEAGDEDQFKLFRSVELMHRLFTDGEVKHEYHLLQGVGHDMDLFPDRLDAALEFIGKAYEK